MNDLPDLDEPNASSQQLEAFVTILVPPFASWLCEALHSLFAARHERA